jgi:hypothetical protein
MFKPAVLEYDCRRGCCHPPARGGYFTGYHVKRKGKQSLSQKKREIADPLLKQGANRYNENEFLCENSLLKGARGLT